MNRTTKCLLLFPFVFFAKFTNAQPTPEKSITVDELEQILSWNYSDDGQKLAVANKDVWVLDNHTEKRLFRGSGGNLLISHIAFSPDSQLIAANTDRAAVKIWNTVTGEESFIHTDSHQFDVGDIPSSNISGIVFTEKGNQLWTCETSGKIQLWDLETKKELKRFDKSGGITRNMEISPDNEFILVQNYQGAEVINAQTGVSVQNYIFGDGATLSYDGKSFFIMQSGTVNGIDLPQVHQIDLRTGEILWKSPILKSDLGIYAELSKDGRYLYVTDFETQNISRLVDVMKDTVIMTFELDKRINISSPKFSKDDKKFINKNMKVLKKWDIASFVAAVKNPTQFEN